MTMETIPTRARRGLTPTPRRPQVSRLLLLWLLTALLSSCGDLFSFTPAPAPGVTMTLSHHRLTLMPGSRFTIEPAFSPDTLANKAVYWLSEDTTVATFQGNELVAVGPGETIVTAISVQTRGYDTCRVVVTPAFAVATGEYLYDMLLYCHITVGGQPLQPHQHVAAFCGNEVRGVARLQQQHGISYHVMRIFSYRNPEGPFTDVNPQDPLYPYDDPQQPERFVVRLYDERTQQFAELPDTIVFDGETHGTLSSLYPLHF